MAESCLKIGVYLVHTPLLPFGSFNVSLVVVV